VFLLDMSTSVCSADGGTAFGRVKDFLRATVSDLPVAPTQFRVAVVGYSSSATISIDFTPLMRSHALAVRDERISHSELPESSSSTLSRPVVRGSLLFWFWLAWAAQRCRLQP
jgi:hypothetical protein